MAELRNYFDLSEGLSNGLPNLRNYFDLSEVLGGGVPNLRQYLIISEALSEGYPQLRDTFMLLETLHPVEPEAFMSTISFPGFGNSDIDPSIPAARDPFATKLPGLTFSVHKKPLFRTRISSAAAGTEVRNPMMQYPIWEFELEYEFLEDRTGAESSLKTLVGFFLSRQGSFDSWLFKDPDDYLCDNHFCGQADGTILEFPFSRVLGGFREQVGQVDTANAVTVFLTVLEDQTIPGVGPYEITADNAADFIEDLGVTEGGIPMTKVSGAPGLNQYSVNETTGVYTFNSGNASQAIVLNYRYELASSGYNVVMPNRLVFDVAPPEGEISWSGQFFFVCRFMEDQQDYEKFMDKLWSLQACEFRSIIQ